MSGEETLVMITCILSLFACAVLALVVLKETE